VAERWREIMRSLPSGSWIDLEFAEAACKRIAELERDLEVSREARRCVERQRDELDALGLAAHSIVKRSEADDECARLRKRIAELEAENASMRHLMESARTYVLERESPCPDLALRARAYDRIRAEIQDLEVGRG
jgi:hypothetical protein